MVAAFINLLKQDTLWDPSTSDQSLSRSHFSFFPSPLLLYHPSLLFSLFPLLPLLSQPPSNCPPFFQWPLIYLPPSVLILQKWSCMHLFSANFTAFCCLRIKSKICYCHWVFPSGAPGLLSFSISTTQPTLCQGFCIHRTSAPSSLQWK